MTQINNQTTSNFHEVYSKLLGISKGETAETPQEVAPSDQLMRDLYASITNMVDTKFSVDDIYNHVNDFTSFKQIVADEIFSEPELAMNTTPEQKELIKSVIDSINESYQEQQKNAEEKLEKLKELQDEFQKQTENVAKTLIAVDDKQKDLLTREDVEKEVELAISEMFDTLEEQQEKMLSQIAETWLEENKIAIAENVSTSIERQFLQEMQSVFAKYSGLIAEQEETEDKVPEEPEEDEKSEKEQEELEEMVAKLSQHLKTLSEQVKKSVCQDKDDEKDDKEPEEPEEDKDDDKDDEKTQTIKEQVEQIQHQGIIKESKQHQDFDMTEFLRSLH